MSCSVRHCRLLRVQSKFKADSGPTPDICIDLFYTHLTIPQFDSKFYFQGGLFRRGTLCQDWIRFIHRLSVKGHLEVGQSMSSGILHRKGSWSMLIPPRSTLTTPSFPSILISNPVHSLSSPTMTLTCNIHKGSNMLMSNMTLNIHRKYNVLYRISCWWPWPEKHTKVIIRKFLLWPWHICTNDQILQGGMLPMKTQSWKFCQFSIKMPTL